MKEKKKCKPQSLRWEWKFYLWIDYISEKENCHVKVHNQWRDVISE